MNRGQLRHRTMLRLKAYTGDLKENFDQSEELIDAILEEGHKEFCRETLILEAKDTSLTYSSANDGFGVPTGFLKVKYLEWETSENQYSRIEPTSIEWVKNRRNEWKNLGDESASEIGPGHYAIFNDYIVLDSTIQTSPNLYYYKYGTAFSADSSSPAYGEEFHKYIVDYAMWQLTGDEKALLQWQFGIRKQMQKKIKVENKQSRYIEF